MTSYDKVSHIQTIKLAIIISCYNYEEYIGQAIESVLCQITPECELVIVDDGSDDRSWDIIAKYNLRCYRTENRGQLSACIYGLDRTTAPFILFMDADDLLKPGCIDLILNMLNSRVAKIQFSLTRIDAQGNIIGEAMPKLGDFNDRNKIRREVLRNGVYTCPPTTGNIFRRDVCQTLRNIDYDKAVDGVILFASPFYGDIISTSQELGCYRIHERNYSGIGDIPTEKKLKRDIDRFSNRMSHLKEIIREKTKIGCVWEPHNLYHFKEQKFYLAALEHDRRKAAMVIPLIGTLWGTSNSITRKLAFSSLFFIIAILPPKNAKALLAYRFSHKPRNFLGAIKVVLSSND